MEVVTILVASSTIVIAAGIAIAMVLRTLHRKPILAKCHKLMPITDDSGNMLLDKEGKPLLQRVEEAYLLEPRKADNKKVFEASFNGMVIKFESSDKEMETPKTDKAD